MEEMHGAVGSTVHVVFGMVRVESGDELRVASCELRGEKAEVEVEIQRPLF